MAEPNGAGGREPDVLRIIRRNELKLAAIRSTFTITDPDHRLNARHESAVTIGSFWVSRAQKDRLRIKAHRRFLESDCGLIGG
jgi:hypothetical protein